MVNNPQLFYYFSCTLKTTRIAFLAVANSIHTVRWVNALAQRGYDILLLSLQKNTAPLHAGVTLKRLPIPAPLGYFLNTATARFHLQNFQAEMIHAHYASGYGTLARKLNLKPLCERYSWSASVLLLEGIYQELLSGD